MLFSQLKNTAATLIMLACASNALSQANLNPDKATGDLLYSTDNTLRDKAIADIRQRFAEDPKAIGGLLRKFWLAPMAKAGFNEDIVTMTQTAILAEPGSALTFEPMLRARVWALIALGRKDEALADARRYYNVCGLDKTGLAVDLLAQAMEAKLGDDAQPKIRQFRMRQMIAATADDGSNAPQPTTGPSIEQHNPAIADTKALDQMILSIPIDEKPYIAELTKWKNNRRQPMAYGNLLLMAGRADEACAYFTDLLNNAKTDKDLAYALERQSAAMRAQDGNIARAQGRLRRLQAGGM